MPLPPDILEELARKRRAESRLANRDRVQDFALTVLYCLLWAVAGLACIAVSAHTTVMWFAKAMFWAGLGVGNAGILFTLLAAYRRGEQRGDW